ncbi:hypothetical protein [Campylobacter gastrosuis]|uniref:Uncharacterized protein n=1 Tax=Campylobacter gastrosuis TaxID=2974576 RepID=A0ABT7HTH9_9BACT|nr:hypothetical protein [Campylobacter gastrosuis]MDL0090050.1 hypothetical protein [Campylobacter gastrosuis]
MKISKILTGFFGLIVATNLMASYTIKPLSELTFNNDTDGAINFSYENINIPLIYNIGQTDPSLIGLLDTSELYKTTGYTCDNKGSKPFICTSKHFFTGIVWSSNSVGGEILLDKETFERLNKDIIFLKRSNATRYSIPNKTPFMNVFIDKQGYLNAQFTRPSGGTSSAKTPKPIPFGQRVYIQANEYGENYEVAWKNLSTGEISSGKAGQQFALDDHNLSRAEFPYGKYNSDLDVVDLDDTFDDLRSVLNDINLKNFFWGPKVEMFEKLGTNDLSDMPVHQKGYPLQFDTNFANRVASDLFFNTNYFKENSLYVYVDNNGYPVVIDIRTKR